jgi:hypothetical protein
MVCSLFFMKFIQELEGKDGQGKEYLILHYINILYYTSLLHH